VNVPASLLHCLHQQQGSSGVVAFLIHISTDQVRARLMLPLCCKAHSPTACRTTRQAADPGRRCLPSSACASTHHQVFDGSRALWSEADPCEPVNVYGSSKLEAEQAIQVRMHGLSEPLFDVSARGDCAPLVCMKQDASSLAHCPPREHGCWLAEQRPKQYIMQLCEKVKMIAAPPARAPSCVRWPHAGVMAPPHHPALQHHLWP